MILTRDQTNRYMRHIAMPGISGQGQKKILDSSVVLFADDLHRASLALYYIAASGVGNVYCSFTDTSGWNELSCGLSDLNGDTNIHLLEDKAIGDLKGHALTCIVSGRPDYVKKTLQYIIENENHIPLIVSVYDGWRGLVQTYANKADARELLTELEKWGALSSCSNAVSFSDNLSCYFSSLMAVIEHLKLTLSLGKPISQGLYFDLSVMKFDFWGNSSEALDKLSGPVAKECCKVPSDSRVLVVGCGGLGSPAAFALAASGIGELGLVDFDAVELSNLNRQIMHSTSRLGMPKVQSAEIFLRQINPDIKLSLHKVKVSRDNVQDIISPYDIIIGGLDNLPGRYMLNDACYAAGKPLVEAGTLDISGLATTIVPGAGHCYRCIFPETGDNNHLPSCSETGVLGPVPGVMGVIQAAEALKLLTGLGESLKNKLLLIDIFETDIFVSAHERNKYCELCGSK